MASTAPSSPAGLQAPPCWDGEAVSSGQLTVLSWLSEPSLTSLLWVQWAPVTEQQLLGEGNQEA